MLGHQLVDYATHSDDAWPPLWPLSSRRWSSPMSYWQREHHARAYAAAESAAFLVALATDRSAPRVVFGVAALAAAFTPVVSDRDYQTLIGGNVDWTSY
jgi:hypothetical protein